MDNKTLNNIPIWAGILTYLYFSFNSPENTAYYHMGIGLMFYYLFSLVLNLGVALPIKDLMALICLLQWIVAPVWVWNNYNDSPINYMPIDEGPYMNVIFPGTIAYLIGLNLVGVKKTEIRNSDAIAHLFEDKENYFEIGKKLVYVGTAMSLAFGILPQSLFYFGLLMANMKLVGAMYIMMSSNKNKWYWVIAVVAYSSVGGLKDAVFHDLIIWIGYIFIIFFLVYKFNFQQKLAMFSSALFLLFILQSVKHEYRNSEFGEADEGALVMYDLFVDRITNLDKVLNKDNYENVVARLNQARIIGFILNNIPANTNYLEGESINMAFESLVPRFLFPDKRVIAGGFDKFALFTGRNLPFGTSMDISLIGEAYGNFGPTGTIVFMLITGIVFNWMISTFLSYSNRFPSIVLWVPFVFFHIIKAESDFSSVLNQIFKSLIMVFLVIRVFGNKLVLKDNRRPVDLR